jgi:hypothetical protein
MSSQTKIAGSTGFTLVEVIATLVVMGFMVLFFINLMGTAMDFGWKSVDLVTGEAEAEGKMEQIIARFVRESNSDPDGALDTLKAKIDAGDYNSDNITVVSAFIDFDAGGQVQTVTDSELLLVTIETSGNKLTAILPKSRWQASDPIIEY